MNELKLDNESAKYIATTIKDGVATVMMNRPEKLNGWTLEMIEAFKAAFKKAAEADEVKTIIFTGKGDYFSAGVNLGGTLQLMHPKKLHGLIIEMNQSLFDAFIDCPKPILVAVNGPAIGASVTSATLCNGIIASERATFSTPFAALGITPEGCSSVHFPRLMGEQNARRMLGEEGWKPTAKEALEAGLVQWVVPHDELHAAAMDIARQWAEDNEPRKFLAGSQREELKAVNARESRELADAFLAAPFLKEQARFLWSKNKRVPAAMFLSLWALRPAWSRLL
ncbi:MAG: enoyl-CoA hydratase/isomerase family protein [Ketobacteraceae bacterium]|nr:enoyl-CoA hydratase/isomerase family protein [Ketobacteraceae bacterium]